MIGNMNLAVDASVLFFFFFLAMPLNCWCSIIWSQQLLFGLAWFSLVSLHLSEEVSVAACLK